ncbi:MAG: hypothetical protein LBE91_08065 [Tannerella sp.]|jgi:hypothetical protein|nr:hypothetical protein [Tannerella sp.]
MNNQFFSVILMTVLFATVFTSCDKNEDEDGDYSSPTPFSGVMSGIIEGECATWDSVGIYFNNGEIIATTPIIDGKFTFSSLPTPKPEDLVPFIDSEVLEETTGYQISDRNVKICAMSLLAMKDTDVSHERKGIVQGVYKISLDPYSYSVNMFMYFYADKDLKIKGSWSDTDTGVKHDLETNINLKRGWNTLYYVESGSEDNNVTTLKNGVPLPESVWREITIDLGEISGGFFRSFRQFR